VSDVCRSLYVTFNKTDRLADNIEVSTFAPEPSLFSNSTENAGFCTPAGHCLLTGLLNMSACVHAPIILSSPHFLFADERLLKQVDGLKPNALLHNTFLSVEPTTGLLMKANKRAQLNVQLVKDKRVQLVQHFAFLQKLYSPKFLFYF
jgi:hypothetical protein